MTARFATLPELNRKAFDILCRELGVAQALRVFSQMGLGSGNYTEERRERFKDFTMEDYDRELALLNAEFDAAKAENTSPATC